MSIITSILDTDVYKLTMGQAAWSQYPDVRGKFKFFNRKGTEFPAGFDETLMREIQQWRKLTLSEYEAALLKSKMPFLREGYIEWLKGTPVLDIDCLDRFEVKFNHRGELEIEYEGPWRFAIYFETPVLAVISELYYKKMGLRLHPGTEREIWDTKSFSLRCIDAFAEFGTRRRFSKAYQGVMLNRLSKPNTMEKPRFPGFVGTSNVMYALEKNLKPIGTVAHEWFMAHQALFGTRMANLEGMRAWQKEYGAALGIMLPDTFTTEMFLHTFDGYYARLCDGVRHDSGDPIEFAEKINRHYRELGIDPASKTIVFSDGLNPDKACEIQKWAKAYGGTKFSFGIGTNLSNDVGHDALSIVIKATEFNGVPVVKISDEYGDVFKERATGPMASNEESKNTTGKVTGAPRAVDHTVYEIKTTLNGRRRF